MLSQMGEYSHSPKLSMHLLYGETLISVQECKDCALVFLPAERTVRIALHAICNQIALDWTADEIIWKNNKNTVCKNI